MVPAVVASKWGHQLIGHLHEALLSKLDWKAIIGSDIIIAFLKGQVTVENEMGAAGWLITIIINIIFSRAI